MSTTQLNRVWWLGAILVIVTGLLSSMLYVLSRRAEAAAAPQPLTTNTLAATNIGVTIGDSSWADDGKCSLREAIANSNNDTQVFASPGECITGTVGADMIVLTLDVTLTITDNNPGGVGDNGLPVVTSTVTISGAGHTLSRAESSPAFRFFYLNDDSSNLTLKNITVTNGGYTATFQGGAINVGAKAKLAIEAATFSENKAALGGAIVVLNNPTLLINNSRFLANHATDSGGALAYHCCGGLKTVINSLFEGNTTEGNGGGHRGECT